MSGPCQPVCEKYAPEVALTPARFSLRIQRGSLTEFDCILTNAFGEPIDISLDTVILTVKDALGGTLKIEKINLPLSHINGPQGRTRFAIEPGDIVDPASYFPIDWVFEVRRVTPVPEEFVHITGPFIIDPEV